MYLRAGGDESLGSGVRPGQSEYLMACLDEFRNNPGTDKNRWRRLEKIRMVISFVCDLCL